MKRRCYKCNKIKLLELFHQQFARWTTKDGIKHKTKSYTNLCKVCNYEYHKNYRNKKRSRINETKRAIYWKDHEKTLKQRANFRDTHRKATTDYAQKYYQKNKKKIYKQNKEWVKNNPEKKKEASNKYSCKPEIKLKDSLKAKKASKNLEDGYVKDTIIKRTSLTRADIPLEMVELKREHLKLTRAIKND
tara:strand:+ start:163 stop:732 length:570 start_codon:yes stop_codon:yes gene_type:complete